MTIQIRNFLAVLIASAVLAGPAVAATFTYDAAVTSSIGAAVGPDDPNLPPIGTAGTVELVIDDSDPNAAIFDLGFNVIQAFTASVVVPGYISGTMLNNPNPADFFSLTTEYLAFGSYGPTSIDDPGSAFFLGNARHSFRVTFGSVLSDIPTTVGEVVAALNLPGASGFFSHELEGSPGFIQTRVEFPVAPVPLPASVWLMLAALGAVGWTGRRKRL